MKKIIFIISFIVCCLNIAVYAEEDEYIVKFKEDTICLYSDNIERLPYTEDMYLTDSKTAEILKKSGNVECVIPNYDVELFDQPNDTYYDSQWSLKEWGYENVYSRGITGKQVRIGIIDSGVYSDHPDLLGKISDESYNIIEQNSNCYDEYGHGTFVAGIIGAETNNGIGISGIAPDANIVMIKCFDGKTTKVSYIISALKYASTLDLDILNLSFGVSFSDTSPNLLLMKEAIDDVYDSGTIIVAAVGNSGSNKMYYPAAFDNVIGVGAVDKNLVYADSSQYNDSVFLTAPGINIKGLCSPELKDGLYYTEMSGTSFSAPYVAAGIALAKECNQELSFDDMCDILKQSTKDAGDIGYDIYYGWGIFNPKVLIDNIIGGTRVYVSLPKWDYNDALNELTINCNTVNRSRHELSFIYAFYLDGKLTDCIESEFKDDVVINSKYSGEQEIKCFVWESLNRMQPYYDVINFKYSD